MTKFKKKKIRQDGITTKEDSIIEVDRDEQLDTDTPPWMPDDGDDIINDTESFLTTTEKVYFSIALIVVVILVWFGIGSLGETQSERIARIHHEITEAQKENISIADKQLKIIDGQKSRVLKQLYILNNKELIFKECIHNNKYGDLPVECSLIELIWTQQLGWRYNTNGKSQVVIKLKSNGIKQRSIELLDKFPLVKGTYPLWEQYGKIYNIKPELAIAIAKADSSLGNELKTKNNIGNVGNNDRGNKVHMDSIAIGIEHIFKTLNNKYLKDNYNVGNLSQGGRLQLQKLLGHNLNSCTSAGPTTKCYATSKENWNINVINTLKLIYNDSSIDELFEFRTITF